MPNAKLDTHQVHVQCMATCLDTKHCYFLPGAGRFLSLVADNLEAAARLALAACKNRAHHSSQVPNAKMCGSNNLMRGVSHVWTWTTNVELATKPALWLPNHQ